MSQYSANPAWLEYNFCREFGVSPNLLEDEKIVLPSKTEILKWLFFGKPIRIVIRKGISTKKADELLAVLNEVRIAEEEKQAQLERDFNARSKMS